jgi:hypothetical protein
MDTPTDTPTDAPTLEPESYLQIAERLVGGDRGAEYGHPFDDFSRTADLLNAMGFLGSNGERKIIPEDIPVIMICVKLSRMYNNEGYRHKDSLIDIAGYIRTLQLVQEV